MRVQISFVCLFFYKNILISPSKMSTYASWNISWYFPHQINIMKLFKPVLILTQVFLLILLV